MIMNLVQTINDEFSGDNLCRGYWLYIKKTGGLEVSRPPVGRQVIAAGLSQQRSMYYVPHSSAGT